MANTSAKRFDRAVSRRTRPRVTVIRGDQLNKFEMQSYERLPAIGIDVVTVGSRKAALGGVRVDLDGQPLWSPRELIGDRIASGLSRRFDWFPDADALMGLRCAARDADVLHTAETFISWSEQAVAIKRKHGARLVITCWENIPFLHDSDPRLHRRKQLVRQAADVFVAVTPEARDALIDEGVEPARIRVIPAGVDVSVFGPGPADPLVREGWNVPDRAPVLLYVGRLIREKGVVELMRAFEHVLGRRPDAHLVLIGEGPERSKLEYVARALDIKANVRFIGSVRYVEIPRFLRAADIFVLPSLATPYWLEQFGMVLVEAMACGTPIVTTKTGSIPSVVGNAAELVHAYAPEELSQAIINLLADDARRDSMGRIARARVCERFNADHVAEQLAELYRDIVA